MATPLTRAEWLDECAKLAKTYEEAMTDEAKALVGRLLDIDDNWHDAVCHEAAAMLRAQQAEIERLREALTDLLNGMDSGWITVKTDKKARAALAGGTNDG